MELTKDWVAKRLPKRLKDANKGMFGKVLVVAGSENFPGAAYLACAAAYRVGAGLVALVTEAVVKIIVTKQLPEVTFLPQNQAIGKIKDYDVVLLGPGLGQEAKTVRFIEGLLKEKLPKSIIDADGLNILSSIDGWWDKLGNEIILTPHPGEMSRLTGLPTKKIQSDRVNIAQGFSKKWNKVLVLKGANTVIASPQEGIMVSPFANPILATAGTGDVLAGAISGLVAQGLTMFDAACAGVYIHGLAGEELKKKIGKGGALAGDLLPLLPQVLKDLI